MGFAEGQQVTVPPPPPPSSVVDVPPPPPTVGAGAPRAGHGVPPGPPPGPFPAPPGPPPPPPPRGGVSSSGPPGAYAHPSADGNPFGGGAVIDSSGANIAHAVNASGASVMSAEVARSLAERAASAIRASLGFVGAQGADPSEYPGMPPGWGAGMSASALQAAYHQHTRQSRRLYVGNVPKGTSDIAVTKFFNDAMLASGAAINPAAGDPVVTTALNPEKGFCFVEFLAMEDAESALMFNDVPFQGSKLSVRRPKDYDPALNPLVVKRGGVDLKTAAEAAANRRMLGLAAGSGAEVPVGVVVDVSQTRPPRRITLDAPPSIASEWSRLPRRVPDGPNKLYVGGFDPLHGETQVRHILQAVGTLKSLAPVPDGAGKFSGHVFFELADTRLTSIAEEALTGIELAVDPAGAHTSRKTRCARRLVCRRVWTPEEWEARAAEKPNPSSTPTFTYEVPASAAALLGEAGRDVSQTNALWVYNAVTRENARDVRRVEDRVRAEAAVEAGWDASAVTSSVEADSGKIVVTFEEGGGDVGERYASPSEAAARCASKMHGRTFEGRPIWVRYAPSATTTTTG